jgi:hypothetical protein
MSRFNAPVRFCSRRVVRELLREGRLRIEWVTALRAEDV